MAVYNSISREKWVGGLVAATLALPFILTALPVLGAPDVPFLASAYEAAAKSPTATGVTATVTMTTIGSGKGPKVLVAIGPLQMEGDLLGGRLPMSFDNAAAAPSGANSLFFNVSKSGRVGLQWLVNDKPLDGRPMQAFDTESSAGTLTKKLNWNGAYRLVSVSIERRLNLMPMGKFPGRFPSRLPGGIFTAKPTPTPKPLFIPGGMIIIKPKPKVATGRRVRVSARFLVTNSEDGLGGIFGNADNSVEMNGLIRFGDQTAFSFSSQSASVTGQDEFQSKKMEPVTITYSDPNARFFKIKGEIHDFDAASAPDSMWQASEIVDLLKIMESGKEYRIKGDRKSESGDLYIRVTDDGEVF